MTGKVPEVGQEERGQIPRDPLIPSRMVNDAFGGVTSSLGNRDQVTRNIIMVVYGEIGRGLALENAKTYGEGRSTPPNASGAPSSCWRLPYRV